MDVVEIVADKDGVETAVLIDIESAGHRQPAGLAQPDAGDCSAQWDLLVV